MNNCNPVSCLTSVFDLLGHHRFGDVLEDKGELFMGGTLGQGEKLRLTVVFAIGAVEHEAMVRVVAVACED